MKISFYMQMKQGFRMHLMHILLLVIHTHPTPLLNLPMQILCT